MILQDENLSADVMFIADLHLHPQQPEITAKFLRFCKWAKQRTKELYILGDFVHAWPGDDGIDVWSDKIIAALSSLADAGVKTYFMAGNRDFLIGKKFLRRANLVELADPSVITLGGKKVLLSHGDRYCTEDISHQRLRRFTRNRIFKLFFLRVPYRYRSQVVNKVRKYSADGKLKPGKNMLAIPSSIAKHLRKYDLATVIHGHTHLPGLTIHRDHFGEYQQYVLSDWDENPLIMCYNSTNEFYYNRFLG